MFPEYRTLITTLKQSDQHFTRLLLLLQIEPGTGVEIENLKKEKLRLKDELYTVLKKASGH